MELESIHVKLIMMAIGIGTIIIGHLINKQPVKLDKELVESIEMQKIHEELRSWVMREEDEIREEVIGLYVKVSRLEKYYLEGLITKENYIGKKIKIREKIDILNWVLGENKEEENEK